MTEINLREFVGSISSTLRRYLFTANFIADSERGLREQFLRELDGSNVFSREPLLSAIPSYEGDLSIRALLERGEPPYLHGSLRQLGTSGLDIDRPLYSHQVASVRLVQSGRNVIVATGTGSGKTECFLLPLLDDAARNPGPGVRAIVVYPMNALANDQLDRMRELLRNISAITFGRYTGDTAEDERELSEEERSTRLPNERITREEIRSRPPHILLTNFAMLEYLLLRPRDAEIFHQERLRFVVLDEAHTYTGAQGIDVGFLMRRLQERYHRCSLQFILTSATLGDEKGSCAVSEFATALTGKHFDPADILLGSRVLAGGGTPERQLADYSRVVPDEFALRNWIHALEDVSEMRSLVMASRIPCGQHVLDRNSVPEMLYAWLRENSEIARLHKACSAQPVSLPDAAEMLFHTREPGAVLVVEWLVILGAHATPDSRTPPLVPGRYHLFFRGLMGGAVCLSSACPGRRSHPDTQWSRLVLEDRRTCPEESCGALLIPLATCAHCGIPSVRIYADSAGHWQGNMQPTLRPVVLTWLRTFGEDEDDEQHSEAILCVRCGALLESEGTCCNNPDYVHLFTLGADGDGNLKTCPNCGGTAQPYPSVLRDMRSYEDAATAVLGEAVIRALPGANPRKPADGRNLLVFSDSRQRAAHYAPYLARTAAETQYMRPLLESVEQVDAANDYQGATVTDVGSRFRQMIQRQPFVAVRVTNDDGECKTDVKPISRLLQQDYANLKRESLIALLEHATASPRRRDTLSALALGAVVTDLSEYEREELRSRLPWLYEPDAQRAEAVIQHLLGFFLQRRAITLPEQVTLRDLGPGAMMATCHLSEQASQGGRQIHRWNPYLAPQRSRSVAVSRNRNLGILERALRCDRNRDAAALESWMTCIWDAFLSIGVLSRLAYPGEYQLPYERILFSTRRTWFLCDRCGRFTVFPFGEACPTPTCSGHVTLLSKEEIEQHWAEHHSYHRLRHTPPLPLDVREHTAQLENKVGRQYQHQFRAGDVNVLSSSTTFELGVDVGSLKAVFLRNVPPTAANYIQRAGRAGRRQGGAAFAVTYARNIPHDQFHFFEQEKIVSGIVAVPRIAITNPRLTQRHVNSYLLGRYWRALATSSNPPLNLEEFFCQPTPDSSAAARFADWVQTNHPGCEAAIARIVPPGGLGVAEALNASVTGMREVATRIAGRIAAYETQRATLASEQATATPERLRTIAGALVSVGKLIGQVLRESVIDVLAEEHWLPSYAFPQDVVRLLVRQGDWSVRLRLERDQEIGISEYAPGSEIVADGKLFASAGIDKQNRELELLDYRACPVCRRVELGRHNSLQPLCPCGAAGTAPALPRPYITPIGFTTRVTDPVEDAKLHRVKAPPTSEVFLVDSAPPEAFQQHAALFGVTYGYRRDGHLFRANKGRRAQRFRLCLSCGSLVQQGTNHEAPWGSRCNGQPQLVDLACEFRTDTLQIRFDGLAVPPQPVQDDKFWLSLQAAFLSSAAETLSIPARDIDGTYRSQSERGFRGELIVYDRVPGGAGYCERICEELPHILSRAWERTARCPNPMCDPSGSCYACLRTYGNQFQWNALDRGAIAAWLIQFQTANGDAR